MLTRANHCHNEVDIFAPKPVLPKAERNHAFFGSEFVHQHMFMDKRWTPSDLMDQYKNVADVLKQRLIFKQLDNKYVRKNLWEEQQALRHEIQDGRIKLRRELGGEPMRKLCKVLRNRKDLQRLYANLSMVQILEITNTRTFKMRKERDRLTSRLENLKTQLQNKLIERETLETRIKYENEFVLQEETKIEELQKGVCNSELRLKTIRTIHTTYKTMIKVINQDAIFFEPILVSLTNDIKDQEKFIQHILYLVPPSRRRQMEMAKECYLLEMQIKNEIQKSQQRPANFKTTSSPVPVADRNAPIKLLKHSYARETKDMKILRETLMEIEMKIKLVQEATLCSKPRYICPTFKKQINCNIDLKKQITMTEMEKSKYSYKKENSTMKNIHLKENFVMVSQFYADRIKRLTASIAKEDEEEKTILEDIKRHSDIWVVLRFTLWNFFDILRNVEDNTRLSITKYPNVYLGLPLFNEVEPPRPFEENVFKIYNIIKHKLQRVVAVYDEEVEKLRNSIGGIKSNQNLAENVRMYHEKLLKYLGNIEISSGSREHQKVDFNLKPDYNIPNRKYIKEMSAKIVEINAKKDV